MEWSQNTWSKWNGVKYHGKFTRIRITAILIATVVGFVGESNSQWQENNTCIAWEMHLALETERKMVKWNLDMPGRPRLLTSVFSIACAFLFMKRKWENYNYWLRESEDTMTSSSFLCKDLTPWEMYSVDQLVDCSNPALKYLRNPPVYGHSLPEESLS